MVIKISNNKELVDQIRCKIKENQGYCISKTEKNEDTRCMCKDFIEQEKLGECACGLYTKIE